MPGRDFQSSINLIGSSRQEQRHHDSIVKFLAEFADSVGRKLPITDLKPSSYDRYRVKMLDKFAPATAQLRFRVVIAFLRWLHQPAELVDKPIYTGSLTVKQQTIRKARNAKRSAFRPDEVQKLLAAADPLMQAFIYLGLYAGYQPADIVDASIGDLNCDELCLMRTKTGSERRAILPQNVVDLLHSLEQYRTNTDALVPTREGERRKRYNSSDRKAFLALRKRAEIESDCGLKSFRKTCRTICGGADEEAARLILGHEKDATTEAYLVNELYGRDRLEACRDAITEWLNRGAK